MARAQEGHHAGLDCDLSLYFLSPTVPIITARIVSSAVGTKCLTSAARSAAESPDFSSFAIYAASTVQLDPLDTQGACPLGSGSVPEFR